MKKHQQQKWIKITYLPKNSFFNNNEIWNLLSNLYNLSDTNKVLKTFPQEELIKISTNEKTLWFSLEKFFTNIFTYNTNFLFFEFLKAYAKYFSQEKKDYEEEWKLTQLYWKFIDAIKKDDLNFNKYLLLINKYLFETQKGFKVKTN